MWYKNKHETLYFDFTGMLLMGIQGISGLWLLYSPLPAV